MRKFYLLGAVLLCTTLVLAALPADQVGNPAKDTARPTALTPGKPALPSVQAAPSVPVVLEKKEAPVPTLKAPAQNPTAALFSNGVVGKGGGGRGLLCPTGSLFSQNSHDTTDSWSAANSDMGPAEQYKIYEDFSCVSGEICDVHWWGLTLAWNSGFSNCTTENPMTFEITFYQDAGGTPGAQVGSIWSVSTTGVATGVLYAGYPSYEYSATLSPCVTGLSNGWISIQGTSIGTPTDCWFLWMSGFGANSHSYQWNGTALTDYLYDNALCLTGNYVEILGACCNDSTGVCTDGVAMIDCCAPGLRFSANTLCQNMVPPCEQVLFPDECATAAPIGNVTNLPFDTTSATTSNVGIHAIGKDLFYCYTASCTGVGLFSLCGTAWDTKIAVWDGCACPPTTELGYNDDYGPACSTSASSVEVTVVLGHHYLVQVGGFSTYSGPGVLTITCTPGSPYCVSKATSTADSLISFVGLAEIQNNSGTVCATYTDFTALPPAYLSPGSSYPIQVTGNTCGGTYTKYCRVWIDANQDFDFTDPGELVYDPNTPSSGNPFTWSGTAVIPVNAVSGATRMRVVVMEGSLPNPCGTYSYGETEDYTVVLGDVYGACCDDDTGNCAYQTYATCTASRFVPNVQCIDLVPACGAVTGACCVGTSCTLEYQIDCTGYYLGDFTTCADSPCSGACCNLLTCIGDYNELDCTAAGGTQWTQGATCVTYVCNPYCPICWTNQTDDWITNVTFNTINNTSGMDLPCKYGNYSALSTIVSPGSTYLLSVTFFSGTYSECVTAWFDWNANGVWEVTEKYDLGCAVNTTVTANITVPGNAAVGAMRMRVTEKYSSAATDPCLGGTWGETEDYTVIVAEVPGACCHADGTCDSQLPDDCAAASGTYGGPNTVCAGADCNGNSVDDFCDIASHFSQDCNDNGIPDECELVGNDCNGNLIPDECDVPPIGTGLDCNGNLIPDACEVPPLGTGPDCNTNGIPDDCETDCNTNGIPDDCDLANCTGQPWCSDCNSNGIIDGCELGRSRDVVYDNGPLITNAGGGYNGANASAIQSSIGGDIYGYGHALSTGYRVADDVTLTKATDIESITFFAYQTGTYAFPPVSTINNVNLRIWDGPPNAGGTVIWGNTTTNVLTSTAWSGIYRSIDTSLLDNGRPIMAQTIAMDLHLDAGTYWLDWQTGGTLASGPWAPPVTRLLTPGSGNAIQWTGTAWAPIQDDVGLWYDDLPFIIDGSQGADCNTNGIPDVCDVPPICTAGPPTCSLDCNTNLVPDECELAGNDCNTNLIPDDCDIANCDGSPWCQDCNHDGIPDGCQLVHDDCNTNDIPDECDIASGFSQDCNTNGVPDDCDILGGFSADCNSNGVPDECEVVWNPGPVLLSEGFEDITTLPPQWVETNHSNPLGTTNWSQGATSVFNAQAGSPASYISANYNNTTTGTISNWLITPVLNLNNGVELSFYTRTATGSTYADRLEVRMSTNGPSSDVGTTEFEVGDFTTLLLSVNPNLVPTGYPQVWEPDGHFTVTLSGLSGATAGRLAFRYFVTDGGGGANSNYIGIDTVTVQAPDVPPASDCNHNNVPDECDVPPICTDPYPACSLDSNANGIPDECEAHCLGDSNCDGLISWRDIDYLVAAMTSPASWVSMFTSTPTCTYWNSDVNGDGVVSWRDIDPFVALFGATCP